MEGTSSCINQHADCWRSPRCLFPPQKNTENKLQLRQKHTHYTHATQPPCPESARHIWWFLKSTHTHPSVCVHMCVDMCVMVWFVCLGRLKHYVSHTHTHIHRQKHADTLYSFCHVYTHTHTFHFWRIGRFLRAAGPTGKNVWTNLRHTHAYAYRHTTEHFQPTMLT